jgi:glycosyltransferase involved in cell wall biosynthesis
VNVAIVNHHDFRSNSGIHVFNLANRLAGLGIEVTAYVPGDPATVTDLGDADFDVKATTDVSTSHVDLVHAWTPRYEVRSLAVALSERHSVPYIVHLEDNEDVVATHEAGLSPAQLRQLSDGQLNELIRNLPEDSPYRYQAFLEAAGGVTAVIERLLEFAPQNTPTVVVWPAYEPDLFRPANADMSLRHELGVENDEQIVVYAGNTHPANAEEVRALYLAVGLVNERGRRLRFIRLGVDDPGFLSTVASEALRYEVRVPYVPRPAIPRYFALANVLVQPGRPNAFNDYRFPSKVPEFLAMGKPVILPATNIGLELKEGDEAMLLRRGDPLELAHVIGKVLGDPDLQQRLGSGARRFAETRLSWDRGAEAVASLYADVLASRHRRSAEII